MVTPDLLAWQWRNYPDAHRDRRNLMLHALTAPLFAAGLSFAPAAFALGHPWLGGGALALLFIALAAQGRGHRLERQPPLPFRSPLDLVARFFVEQLVTFPRFVAAGGFARAWRGAAAAATAETPPGSTVG